jgi:hypothetical protein
LYCDLEITQKMFHESTNFFILGMACFACL